MQSWVFVIWFPTFSLENSCSFIAFLFHALKIWFDKCLPGKHLMLLLAIKVFLNVHEIESGILVPVDLQAF